MQGAWLIVAWLAGAPQGAAAGSAVPPTSTAAADLGEIPLSDEELALLEALATSSAAAEVPAPTAPPSRLVADRWGRRRVAEADLTAPAARSVDEALETQPVLRGGWRYGPNAAVMVEGLLIESRVARAVWRRADPFLFEALTLDELGDHAGVSDALGGALTLSVHRAGARARGEAAALVRTADRGAAAQVDVGGGDAALAARTFATLGHEEALQLSADRAPGALDEAGQREGAGAHVLMTPRPGLSVEGAVLHSAEAGPARHLGLDGAEAARAQLATAALHVGTASTGASLRLGHDRAGLAEAPALERGWQANLQGRWAPLEALQLEAGAFVRRSGSQVGTRTGHRLHAAGVLGVATTLGPFSARAVLRLAHLATEVDDTEVSVTAPLPQVDLHLDLGAFGLRAHVARGVALALPADRLLYGATLTPRDTWTASAGPTWRSAWLHLDLLATAAWIGDLATVTGAEDVRVLALELTGGAHLVEGLDLAFAGAWAEGEADTSATARLEVPNLRGHVALRYTLPVRRAFVELRVRGSSPRWALFSSLLHSDDPWFGFVRVGVMGGVDLGAGLRLEATVENVLDQRVRRLDTAALDPGVELRARLSWAGPT
ncbi:MAG: hypothetical protein H6730_23585 [Deltaproteobacteria bacterium]|nr:hypothetical protein [Deltaproteobacteria bacterium]